MFAAIMILFAISAPFLTSTSAVLIQQIPTTSVTMHPFRVEGTAGADVTVNATINSVTSLFAFQLGLLFDPTTANCTSVVEGGFLSNNGADNASIFEIPGKIDNTIGVVIAYGWSLTNATKAKSGNGVLVRFTFHMKTTGHSGVHLNNLILTKSDRTVIPVKTIDYFTAAGNYVVKVEGNAQTGDGPTGGGYQAYSFSTVNEVINTTTYEGLLSFNVTGYTVNFDTFAYFNVTIPIALMSCTTPDQWLIKLNGVVDGTRTISTLNATHTIVSLAFTYDNSNPTRTVAIISTGAVPESSSVFFATLLVLATFAAALFGKATWSHKRKG